MILLFRRRYDIINQKGRFENKMKVYYETTVPANIVKDKIKREYGEYLQEILSKKLFPEFVKPREKLNRLDYYYNTYAEKKTVSEGVNSRYRISITVEQMRGYSSVCVNVVNGWKKLLPVDPFALIPVCSFGVISFFAYPSIQYVPYTTKIDYFERNFLFGSPLLQFLFATGIGVIASVVFSLLRRWLAEPSEDPQHKLDAFAERLISDIPNLKKTDIQK